MDKIYFYAPTESQRKLLEINYLDSWKGTHSNFTAWIAQTYFHLKNAGFPCEITDTIQQKGIVIADRDTLGNTAQFLPDTMLICAKSDREYHPSAYIHLVHNPYDHNNNHNSIWNSYYITHWPMPNVIPRNQERQTQVKNIAYIGSRSQLAQELKSQDWIDSLSNLGCKWLPIFEVSKWNDYTNIDVIVAARSFDNNRYTNKGFIKLLNCWHAEVPALLAPESSFIAVKKSDLDFIEINSIDDAITAIKKLKENSELYQEIINNYKYRKEEFTTEKVLQEWGDFWKNFINTSYSQWQSMSNYQKRYLFTKRLLGLKITRMKQRLKKII